jgi:hypothetical protein
MSAVDAATLTERALVNLAATDESPEYEVWRRRVRNAFVLEAAAHA